MKTVAVTEFRDECMGLLQQVQDSGEPLLVTRRGQPMARVEPANPAPGRKRRLGVLKGRLKVHGDIVEPNSSDDWEMLVKEICDGDDHSI